MTFSDNHPLLYLLVVVPIVAVLGQSVYVLVKGSSARSVIPPKPAALIVRCCLKAFNQVLL